MTASSELQEILDELAHQLDWRGPTGKRMGHVVLSRGDGVTLVREVCVLQASVLRLPKGPELGPELELSGKAE
jgi:hypothetical protein